MHSDGEQQQLRKWEYYEWGHMTDEEKIEALFESVNELVDTVNSLPRQVEASHSHLIEEEHKKILDYIADMEQACGDTCTASEGTQGCEEAQFYQDMGKELLKIFSLLKRKGV